jgi:hydroxymethylpyrimidine pyrophosphatase-like HAD family hydrolase/energy-coupling factor transporter ATP-binding protein EcfA2
VRYVALACDYDGTIATEGVVPDDVVQAIERVRESGRRTILVTGRELEDLRRVFDRLDVFDRVVAENGAVLFDPATRDARALAEPPPPSFVDALKERRVEPLDVGHIILATWEPNEGAVLEAIHDVGLELQVTFNKGAVMVLPAGITKASGLAEALDELRLSPHNVVGVGDAENDHAFLDLCELSVAVANALPAVKERCDHVTNGARGEGVHELVDALLGSDLEKLDERIARHDITLGTAEGDEPVRIRPYRTNVLVTGPSGSGKSTLANAFIEMLQDDAYQFCLVDPEGDYEDLDRAVVLGSHDNAPTVDEALDALADPHVNLVLNLLGIGLDDRPGFLQSLLPRLQELRAETGRPHWLIVDEAHHLLPSALQTPETTLPKRAASLVLVTVHADAVSRAALEPVNLVLSPAKGALDSLRAFAEAVGIDRPAEGAVEPEDQQAVAWFVGQPPFAFVPAEPAQERRRHRRKYAQGDVEEKAFYFRGPDGRLNLKAQNLALFAQIAEGVDDETWQWHLRRGDYERWFRDAIKDEALAAVAERVTDDPDPETSRRRILEAISERYTMPAEASS